MTKFVKANVVISKTGTARICDYGLDPIYSDPTYTVAVAAGAVGTSRWLAPEIIDPPSKKPAAASKLADVFAFAMLAVEVFTGEVPFGDMKNEAVVIQIAQGKRPTKPQAGEQLGLTTEIWGFIEKCWSADPSKRPTMDEVVRTWEGFVSRCVALPSALFISRHITSRPSTPISASKVRRRRSPLLNSPRNTVSHPDPGRSQRC